MAYEPNVSSLFGGQNSILGNLIRQYAGQGMLAQLAGIEGGRSFMDDIGGPGAGAYDDIKAMLQNNAPPQAGPSATVKIPPVPADLLTKPVSADYSIPSAMRPSTLPVGTARPTPPNPRATSSVQRSAAALPTPPAPIEAPPQKSPTATTKTNGVGWESMVGPAAAALLGYKPKSGGVKGFAEALGMAALAASQGYDTKVKEKKAEASEAKKEAREDKKIELDEKQIANAEKKAANDLGFNLKKLGVETGLKERELEIEAAKVVSGERVRMETLAAKAAENAKRQVFQMDLEILKQQGRLRNKQSEALLKAATKEAQLAADAYEMTFDPKDKAKMESSLARMNSIAAHAFTMDPQEAPTSEEAQPAETTISKTNPLMVPGAVTYTARPVSK